MENFIQPGDAITVPWPIVTVAGCGVQVGDLFGIANASVQPNEPLVISLTGVFDVEKDIATAITLGAMAYWDDAARRITMEPAGNLKIGHVIADAATASETVCVRLG